MQAIIGPVVEMTKNLSRYLVSVVMMQIQTCILMIPVMSHLWTSMFGFVTYFMSVADMGSCCMLVRSCGRGVSFRGGGSC